jgi:flagellar motility protein MotE (MotC chaperone)
MNHHDQILHRLQELGVDGMITQHWKTLHQVSSSSKLARKRKWFWIVIFGIFVLIGISLGNSYCQNLTQGQLQMQWIQHWIVQLGQTILSPALADTTSPIQPNSSGAINCKDSARSEPVDITSQNREPTEIRYNDSDKKIVLFKAIQETIDQKIQQFERLRKEWEMALQSNQASSQKRITELVQLCEKMNAKKAAERLDLLPTSILIVLFKIMNKNRAALILEQMDPTKVKDFLTELASNQNHDWSRFLSESSHLLNRKTTQSVFIK